MTTNWIAKSVVVLLLAASAQAQWKPPADKKFTEDQLKVFLDTQKDWLSENAQILHDISVSQTDATRIAAAGGLDKRYQACLARHNISREEYEWLAQQTMAAWSSLTFFDKAYKDTNDQIDAQTKENSAKLADAQDRLATYQKAQNDGVRVMTPDDRAESIKSAKDEQQSALDEAKQRGDDAAAAKTEAEQQNTDAKTADDLAANPPSDISPGDRPAYIDNKKSEARAARDAASDAFTRKSEAIKAQADAQARATVAGLKAAHPETPITQDDKATVKSDNDAAIATAQADITECRQQSTQMAAESQQLKISAQQMNNDTPQENLDLMREYADRYHDQLTSAFSAGSTTQPAHQ
jgi:hypothetical protein